MKNINPLVKMISKSSGLKIIKRCLYGNGQRSFFLRNKNSLLLYVSGTIGALLSFVCVAKTTTIKEALKRWEEINQKNASEAIEVDLQFQWLPIEKMDNSLSQLVKCEKLSLSTNMIEKISGLSGLKNLKIISLGRNYIKSIGGLECVGETLEQLWVSYNLIDKLKGVGALKKLKVLYMSNNLIKDWIEFQKLAECPELRELSFTGNPLCETLEEGVWRVEATRRVQQIDKLDGEPVINDINTNIEK